MKVLMLIPVLLVIRVMWRRMTASQTEGSIPFPWYILGFVGFAIFNSLVKLSGAVRSAILSFDVFLFTMVMVALGLNTRAERIGESMQAMRIIGSSVVALAFAIGVAYALVQAGISLKAGTALASGTGAAHKMNTVNSEGARLFRSVGCENCSARN